MADIIKHYIDNMNHLESDKRIDLINGQIVIYIAYIISLVISVFLSNNRKKSIIDGTDSTTNNSIAFLRHFNKKLLVSIYLALIYIGYVSYKETGDEFDWITLIAVIIATIGPVIVLVIYLSAEEEGEGMNPIL